MDQDEPTGVFRPASGPLPDQALIVHADASWYDHVRKGGAAFFEAIGKAAQARGIATVLTPADRFRAPEHRPGHRHILFGPKHLHGPGIFHAFPAYIKGFWYLDPQGYFWNSSLVDKVFDPEMVDAEAAAAFFQRITTHRIRRNVSQRKQAEPADLPPADAAIFTQDIERYADQVHYLTTAEMIRTTARSLTGRVYVKPHPLMTAQQRTRLARHCARLPNAVLTDASLHDIIRASGIVVSQNSAVGVEALMHRKPVLTCAATDYHQGSLVCTTAEHLRANLARAPAHGAAFPFQQYFYWLMGLNLIEAQHPDCAARAMARLYGP